MISVMDILSARPIEYHNIKNAVAVDKNTEQNYRVECGDLIFVRSSEVVNEVGWAKAYSDDDYALFSGFTIRGKKKEMFDSYFVELVLNYKNRMQIESKAGGSTRFNVSQIILSNLSFKQPSVPEQTTVGNFFRTLDDTITLHKRKLDGLKELKRGYLQQMFPQAGESVPRVRFAEFTKPWQKRTLGNVVERVIRKNKGPESTMALTISAQHGLIAQKDFFDKEVASKDVSNYYLVKNGEFAYNKSYSNGYPWGAVKRLDNYEMGVLSTLYIVFKPTNIDSEFLAQYYETTYWHNEVAQYAAEGARNHGLLNIATSDFFEAVLAIPADSNEQAAIGNFFRTLDGQIISQEQKLNQLNQLKSAYLQKMFI